MTASFVAVSCTARMQHLEEAYMLQSFLLSMHTKIFSFLLALSFGFLVFSAPGICATVELAWDKPTDSSQIAGYNLYYAPSGNSFPNQPTQVVDAPDKTNCTISGLTEGQIYGFVATSFDADGNESSYSNEVYYTIPSSSTSQDSDGDGLSDDEEELYGLDPTNPDTNGNGIPDQDEVDLWGDAWDGDIDGDGTINLMDLDADGDGVCDATELLHGKDPADSSDNPSGLPPMVFGDVPVDQEWTTVELNTTFQHPVVVAGPLSQSDQDPAVVRTRNINSQGFEIRLQEYDYQDGLHAQEQVSFLVMEMGNYYLPDGTHIEASYFETQAMYSDFDTISFNSPFQTQPVITTSITTFNAQRAVTGRIHNAGTQGFDYSLQEEEYSAESHAQESVAYIAWEPSKGEIDDTQFEVSLAHNITHDPQQIIYEQSFANTPSFLASMQSCQDGDTANLRFTEKSDQGLNLNVVEEQSLDDETSHTKETIGYISFAHNEITSQNELPISKDTTISGYSDGEKTMNFGGFETLRIWSDGVRKILVKPDLSHIPQDTQFEKVELKLYCYELNWPGDTTIEAYSVNTPWVEGTGVYSYEIPDGATWLESNYVDHEQTADGDWSQSGGDVDTATDFGHGSNGLVATADMAQGSWVTLDITDLAQKWLSGEIENNGVLLQATDIGNNAANFYSSEASNETFKPKLNISYDSGSQDTDEDNSTEPKETVSFTDTILDTTLDGYSDWYKGRNYGESETLRIWSDGVRKILIKSDMSRIPSDADLVSAKLKLYCQELNWPGDTALEAYRVTAPWQEGSAGDCYDSPDGATWIETSYVDNDLSQEGNWNQPGGDLDTSTDFGHGSNGLVASGNMAQGSWVTLDITALVQKWISGDLTNNGILLQATHRGRNAARFSSSEAAENMPVLEVQYQ